MKMIIAVRSEWLKLKRTTVFYLCFILAALLPLMLLISTSTDAQPMLHFKTGPWGYFIWQGWQGVQLIMLPLYLVLICTLLPQIEYRNHTWKQVFAAPQPAPRIFGARLVTMQLLLLLFLLLHNVFILLVAMIANLIHPELQLFHHTPDWSGLLYDNAKSYLSVLGMGTAVFWVGLRARSFIVPIGIGVCLWAIGMMLIFEYRWAHVDRWPFAYPVLFFLPKFADKVPAMMWCSILYALLFCGLACIDFSRRRIR